MKKPTPPDAEPAVPSTIAYEDLPSELPRLVTLLRHATGGTWVLAIYESALIRNNIIATLRVMLAPLPVREERLDPDHPDPLPILRALPQDGYGAPVVCLTGVEEAFPDLFGYLDLQRESLAQMPQRLVLWMTEYGWRELAEHAPNFYSRLSGVFHFPGRTPSMETRADTQHGADRQPMPTGSRLRPPIPVKDERDREQRIAYLERRANELSALPRPEPAAIAGTFYDLGTLFADSYQWTKARDAYLEAARHYTQIGQESGQANALYQAGGACYYSDRWMEAEDHYHQALTLYRLLGDRLGEANVLKAIGDVLYFLKRTDEALAKYDAALGLFRAVGARLGEANVLQAQGDVLAFLDRRDEALAKYDAALGLFRAVGARLGEANVLQAQGSAALRAGETDRGLALLEQARQLYAAVGARVGLSNVAITLARHAAAQGDLAKAIEYMQPAADFGIEQNHPLGPQLQAEIDEWKAQLEQQQALTRLLAQWQPIIAAVVATAQGDAEAARQLAPFLDQMSATTDWENLVAALRRVLAGERDPKALAEGLDTTDRVILTATLVALAQATAPELTPAELKPHLEQAAAEARAASDTGRLADVLALLADVCEKLADWPAVVAACDELLALRPDAETWNRRGNALDAQQNHAAAVESYSQAIALAEFQTSEVSGTSEVSRYAYLYRNRADALVELGRLDEAEADCQKAQALDSENPRMAGRWGQLGVAQRRFAEAEPLLRTAIEGTSLADWGGWLALALLGQELTDEAGKVLEGWGKTASPDDWVAWMRWCARLGITPPSSPMFPS